MRVAVLGPDVLEQQLLGDDPAGVERLEHREDVGVLLQLERQRGARARAARRTARGSPRRRPAARRGRAAGSGRCPSRRGRAAARRGRAARRSTGARRRTSPDARPCRRRRGSGRTRPWRCAHQRRELLRRVDVVRQPGGVVEDLGQPAEARRVAGGVRRAQDRGGIGGDRVPQQAAARRRSADQVAEPLVVGADPVVGLGGRGQPALADRAALADVVPVLGQARAAGPAAGSRGRPTPARSAARRCRRRAVGAAGRAQRPRRRSRSRPSRPSRDALHEVPLEDDEHDDHRQGGDHRAREQQRPRRPVLHDEEREPDRRRDLVRART